MSCSTRPVWSAWAGGDHAAAAVPTASAASNRMRARRSRELRSGSTGALLPEEVRTYEEHAGFGVVLRLPPARVVECQLDGPGFRSGAVRGDGEREEAHGDVPRVRGRLVHRSLVALEQRHVLVEE